MCLTMVGCAKSPPVPTDSFYLLGEPALVGTSAIEPWTELLLVERFAADALRNERAMVYSEDRDGLMLKRYAYHLWANSPAIMLQHRLADILRDRGAAKVVMTDPSPAATATVHGRIRRFEQHIASGNGQTTAPDWQGVVHVELELRLDIRGQRGPILVERYRRREPINGATMVDASEAFGRAVGSIFEEFAEDVTQRVTNTQIMK
jgi:ABC-type uncharacterized transport system auxiliary subunit